uniref:Layilin n=1 Tax=Bubo bubo TaxID=30461 RepID=A0A8C0F0D8_BUBBB
LLPGQSVASRFCNRCLSISAGQAVCRGGTQQPCYKMVYFHDASRRISYEEAHRACRADGGHLVSIETEAEQRLIEKFIERLLASDGDFWIGLRRKKEEVDNSTECQNLYSWSDGSSSKFRNWYVDEPSCGSEICVVMYHQPSAPPGVGGPYMFQWNDDRCNMKNNFICKYSLGNESFCSFKNQPAPSPQEEPLNPVFPEECHKKDANVTVVEARGMLYIRQRPVLSLTVEANISQQSTFQFEVFDPKCRSLNLDNFIRKKDFPPIFSSTYLNWLLWLPKCSKSKAVQSTLGLKKVLLIS